MVKKSITYFEQNRRTPEGVEDVYNTIFAVAEK